MINKNIQLSQLGEGLNAMGQQMQLSLEISKRDRRKNLAIILYSYVLSLFQSILREVDDRHIANAYAKLPDIIDSAFATAAVVGNPATAECFFDDGDLQQVYHLNRVQSIPRDISGRIRELTGLYFARQIGLGDYFSAFHHILWRAEHRVREGHPTYQPTMNTVELNPLVPACESMFLATRHIVDFFDVRDLDKEYYEYWHKFTDLVSPEQAA